MIYVTDDLASHNAARDQVFPSRRSTMPGPMAAAARSASRRLPGEWRAGRLPTLGSQASGALVPWNFWENEKWMVSEPLWTIDFFDICFRLFLFWEMMTVKTRTLVKVIPIVHSQQNKQPARFPVEIHPQKPSKTMFFFFPIGTCLQLAARPRLREKTLMIPWHQAIQAVQRCMSCDTNCQKLGLRYGAVTFGAKKDWKKTGDFGSSDIRDFFEVSWQSPWSFYIGALGLSRKNLKCSLHVIKQNKTIPRKGSPARLVLCNGTGHLGTAAFMTVTILTTTVAARSWANDLPVNCHRIEDIWMGLLRNDGTWYS